MMWCVAEGPALRGEVAGRRFWKAERVKRMMDSLPGLAARTQGSTR